MTGTPSRTATAASRGVVGRKLQAKPRPEAHEPHTRHPEGGEEPLVSEARCHPDPGLYMRRVDGVKVTRLTLGGLLFCFEERPR
jgi:hypothetical protein